MAFGAPGFKTLTHIGTTDASVAGSNIAQHAYVTNDAVATVETSNYFLPVYARLKKGDQIAATMVLSGSVVARWYVVTASSASTVTIAPFSATAIA